MTRVLLRIRRQDGPDRPETRRFDEFEVVAERTDTVATALFAIQRHPVTTRGERVSPVAFDSSCRSDGCGACTLLLNGRVRSACRAHLLRERPKRGPIVLEPLGKLPLVRDLVVDRSPLRRRLLHARAFVDGALRERDSTLDLAALDRCTGCAACFEACPQTGPLSPFVGPAALNEGRLLNALAPSADERRSRLRALMSPGGIQDCGKARTCVEVCPENIPLFESILELSADTARLWLSSLLGR